MHRTARLFRTRLAASLRDFGLTPQQGAVVMSIAEYPAEGCTPGGDVGEAIDADGPTTTGLLCRLERDGWIASSRNRADGRSRVLRLTDKGRQALPSLFEAAEQASRSTMSVLTDEESTRLVALLSRLTGQPEQPTGPSADAGPSQRRRPL